jgi:hypothetical protein
VVVATVVLLAIVTNSHVTSSSLSLSLSGKHTTYCTHSRRSRSRHVLVPHYHADALNCCESLPITRFLLLLFSWCRMLLESSNSMTVVYLMALVQGVMTVRVNHLTNTFTLAIIQTGEHWVNVNQLWIWVSRYFPLASAAFGPPLQRLYKYSSRRR